MLKSKAGFPGVSCAVLVPRSPLLRGILAKSDPLIIGRVCWRVMIRVSRQVGKYGVDGLKQASPKKERKRV